MPKTKEQISVDVLQKIGELATGQTARAADLKVCTDKYDQVYGMLQKPELLTDWDIADPVPDIDIDPMVSLVAYGVRTNFSVKGQTLTDILAEGNPKNGTAYDRLRANRHTNWTGDEEPTEMEYF